MDKKFLRVLSGLALVMALGFSGAAWGGSISTIDAPEVVGSWEQTFRWYPPPDNIDKIESFIVLSSATDFEAPGLKDFTNGWVIGTLVNPDYTIAQGAAASAPFTFKSVYTADLDVPFYQDFIGSFNGSVSEAWRFHWLGSNGSRWELVTGVDIKDQIVSGSMLENRSAVPLAPSVLLLGSGLLGLGILGWSRRKNS
jgi:hypothetical protein